MSCNFDFKKSRLLGLDFLYNNFLSVFQGLLVNTLRLHANLWLCHSVS